MVVTRVMAPARLWSPAEGLPLPLMERQCDHRLLMAAPALMEVWMRDRHVKCIFLSISHLMRGPACLRSHA